MATPAGWRQEGNLPVELTSFVGRTRLLASLRQRLQEHRLITVTGIGGVGKSRTALRLAHQVRQRYRHGVWYVELARLQDPGMLYHTITAALGIADQSPREGADTLAEWLAERELLLILDTCEHLVDACAHLTQKLLDTAPHLRILATSRRSLNAPGEYTASVPPLTLPGDNPSDNPFTNEAVELFGARASAVVPDFAVDEDNITAVTELCRRLDGIPLAIELAAVRLRTLSVEQILALLADRFSLLAGASRTALPRHQTLRAAIGWSHELCEPAERLLWARLSVFAGDFELEAARHVCAGDALPSDRILDVIGGLVDKSVLLSFPTPGRSALPADRHAAAVRRRVAGQARRDAGPASPPPRLLPSARRAQRTLVVGTAPGPLVHADAPGARQHPRRPRLLPVHPRRGAGRTRAAVGAVVSVGRLRFRP
ncbi:ATP-binding protein [Microbispora bryophytorum]|uniref:ATP-binding protein n=1 Tax=Microbispora bryophytorum TaxID=1460882 RepID=UPI001CC2A684|nr:AAA family ATPase [Microbispora bryophytorum]